MTRFIVGVLATAILVAFPTASKAESKTDSSNSPLLASGQLQKSRDTLAMIFQFKLEDGQLQIDRSNWESQAKEIEKQQAEAAKEAQEKKKARFPHQNTEFDERMQDERDAKEFVENRRRARAIAKMGPVPPLHTFFIKIQQDAWIGSYGGSGGNSFPGHSINGDWKEWQNAFRANKSLSGDLHTNNDGEILLLQELSSPGRSLDFHTNNKSGFDLRLSEPDGDTILLRQDDHGRFFVVALTAKETFSAQADSFAALYKQHPDKMRDAVSPILANFGIDLPSPNSADSNAPPPKTAQASQQPSWKDWSLLADAPWQKAQYELGQIFDFKIDNGNLVMNRVAHEREAKTIEKDNPDINNPFPKPPGELAKDPQAAAVFEMTKGIFSMFDRGSQPPIITLFENLEKEFSNGNGGHGGGGTGEDASWDASFYGQNVSGHVEATIHTSNLVLTETQSPKRKLHFYSDDKLGFYIELSNDDGDLFSLRQGDGGRFTILAISGDRLYVGQAESFIAFCKQHQQLVDSELLPILVPIGFTPILPANSNEVRAAVLDLLLRPTPMRASGDKLLADLDSDNIDTRQNAVQELTRGYHVFADLIQEKMKDKSISNEMRLKLHQIIADNENFPPAEQTIAALGLKNDPIYVVSLLDGVQPSDMPKITGHLEQITGQNLGANPAAWKKWAKEQSSQDQSVH